MPVYSTSISVRHSREDMFDLVSDVRRYPEFVKWIQTMVVSGERTEGAVTTCLGDARVGFRGISERFATKVTADREAWTITADRVRGPFRRLHNVWSFHEIDGGGTQIDFKIDYSFSNIMLSMLARNNLGLAVEKIMASFIAEADRRYGASLSVSE